jgi:hypothetical protein
MDLITIVVVAIGAWCTLAVVVFALCRASAHSDRRSEHLYRSRDTSAP